MAYQSFEQLEVWRLARKLAGDVYAEIRPCRDFHFRGQITNAVCSIANNLAEGSERLHRKEFIMFLGYAKGSAGEVRNQLYRAEDLGYITSDRAAQLRADARLLGGKIYALIRSLSTATLVLKP
ncbi:MAG: four helix bundle protein [Opitutaceae bacterium]|nr:four helix bundle protein [Opitutaceae bacterium]